MYRVVLLFACIIGACSCNNTNDTSPSSSTDLQVNDYADTSAKLETELSGCYLRVTGRDSLVASLQQQGDRISGKLSFDNYQKDGSSGTVEGKVKDSIIQLVYSFRSEGMNSVMEVYFRVEGGDLVQGVGNMKNRGDTVYFENPAKVQFPRGNPLKRFACKELPFKYR